MKYDSLLSQLNQPAERITARLRKMAKQVHVNLLRVDSALLALLNIELPLAASPPMPSPLGLCSKTRRMRISPVPIQVQERIDVNIVIRLKLEDGQKSWTDQHLRSVQSDWCLSSLQAFAS